MTAFNAPVSAATPELAMLAAFGKVTLAPVVLDGTLRSGLGIEATNSARLEGAQRAEVKRQAEALKRAQEWDAKVAAMMAPPAPVVEAIELEEGESLTADLRDEGTLVEIGDDVAEVVALIEDADGVTWVRVIPAETGEALDIAEGDWEAYLGATGEAEVLSAWDPSEVARMRSELIAA